MGSRSRISPYAPLTARPLALTAYRIDGLVGVSVNRGVGLLVADELRNLNIALTGSTMRPSAAPSGQILKPLDPLGGHVTIDPSSASRRSLMSAAAAVAVLVLGACGSQGSTTTRPANKAPAANPIGGAGIAGGASGGPLAPTGRDWTTLLESASHFGVAPAVGPHSGREKWHRRLEGPIVQGPVTRGNIAYISSTKGILHAIDLTSGRDLWTFNAGAGGRPSDLSTSPTVLSNGTILLPASGTRVVALNSAGHVRWSVTGSGEPLTPVVDEARRLLVIADTAGHVSGYRLGSGDAAPVRLWTRTVGTESFGNPALGSDGTTTRPQATCWRQLPPTARCAGG